jgi:CRISP-associated protein Cas1
MKGAAPAKATELGRLGDRLSFLYIEHARVDRDANAVTFWRDTGIAHVPVAMLAALLLGPGTRITHAAVSLLAGNGCSVMWVGEKGVRLYAGSTATATSSSLLQRQAELVSDPKARLQVARRMYEARFPGEDVSGLTITQLRGREGVRVRKCYQEHSERTGVKWHRRSYLPGKWGAADPVNRALSSANSCLYGVAHAAVAHLGCSAGLGFIHTGHQHAFLFDLADLCKAQVSIPAAFDTVAAGTQNLDSRARHAVRDQIAATGLLGRFVTGIKALLGAPESEDGPGGYLVGALFDDKGTVPGGRAYGEVTP